MINRPTRVALNGLDYIDFKNRGVPEWSELTATAKAFVCQVERTLGVNVSLLGTGPRLADLISFARDRVKPQVGLAVSSSSE
jgi:adenylosuccinate synthase